MKANRPWMVLVPPAASSDSDAPPNVVAGPDPFEALAITSHVKAVNSSNLDGPTLARTFNGGITSWDGPAIEGKHLGLVSTTTGSVAKTIAGARQ